MQGKMAMIPARGRSLNLRTAHTMHTRSTGCGQNRKCRKPLKL